MIEVQIHWNSPLKFRSGFDSIWIYLALFVSASFICIIKAISLSFTFTMPISHSFILISFWPIMLKAGFLVTHRIFSFIYLSKLVFSSSGHPASASTC